MALAAWRRNGGETGVNLAIISNRRRGEMAARNSQPWLKIMKIIMA
jgi:hypothetical protein